jgi:hypothetical protein
VVTKIVVPCATVVCSHLSALPSRILREGLPWWATVLRINNLVHSPFTATVMWLPPATHPASLAPSHHPTQPARRWRLSSSPTYSPGCDICMGLRCRVILGDNVPHSPLYLIHVVGGSCLAIAFSHLFLPNDIEGPFVTASPPVLSPMAVPWA